MFKKAFMLLSAGVLVSAGVVASGGEKSGIDVIQAKFPGIKTDEIQASPVDGWYEVALGPEIVYVSGDAKYILRGDLIDLDTNVNLTEKRRNTARQAMLESVPAEQKIVFSPEADKVKHTITVFTDIDCGYCRKLHSEMAELNGHGISVEYMFYPRSGPNSPSWEKAGAVWCADDRQEALTIAKLGQPVEPKSCETPISAHYDVGRQLGLRGTPMIVTETGEKIAGYLPAAQLSRRLDASAKSAKVAAVGN